MPRAVQVVGSGVVGLTSAVRLVEAGYAVQILSRDPPEQTTSAVAGGLWLPYRAEPAERVAAWARATLEHLLELHRLDEAAGVELREGVLLHHEVPPHPVWADELADLVPLRRVDDPAPGYRYGLEMRVPIVDVARHLAYLRDRLLRAGGQLVQASLSELPDRGLVVNATGLGARSLAGDSTVFPVRGQVVVLDNPGLSRWVADDEEIANEMIYVLPRRHDLVVGGSAHEGDWSEVVDPDLAERMLARAYRLVPELRRARVRAHRVGLRPARPSVRLEAVPGRDGGVVHCYGHGGAGLTLGWGCAAEVLALIRQLEQAGC
jgi:D-amino-acid oxidase